MPLQLSGTDSLIRRAEELFFQGNTAAGSMQLLLATRLLDLPANGIASALPSGSRHYASAIAQYTALVEAMCSRALRARSSAYAPYSHYCVGAALLADDGTLWSGCNVESGSYGLTICAERTALVTAVAHGKRSFAAIAVATESSPPASPCGACRQMLYEFAPDLLVVMLNPEGEEHWVTLRTLLPDAFSPHSLPQRTA